MLRTTACSHVSGIRAFSRVFAAIVCCSNSLELINCGTGCATFASFHLTRSGCADLSDRSSCVGGRAGESSAVNARCFFSLGIAKCFFPIQWHFWGHSCYQCVWRCASSTIVPGPSSTGRPLSSIIVPSFVSTFIAPVMSVSSCAVSAASSLFGAPRDVAVASTVHSSPVVDHPFVVGPGFSTVPAKLVSQILAGKYIDLNELLPANLQLKEPEPQLLLDGRLVLTSQPKKPHRCIDDIATWSEAFAIFSLILVTHFPYRWKDLIQYQLLILCTHRHFGGRVWLTYDEAFREHAAATRLTDWSCMDVQLFNFHAAGSSSRSSTATHSADWEPSGSSGSLVVCISWNKSRCTSPFATCRYAHRCSSCSGSHRASACPSSSSSKFSRGNGKRRSSSPSATGSSSGSKSRRS